MKGKAIAVIGMLMGCLACSASDILKSVASRTIVQVGGSLVEGDGWAPENQGYGLHVRSFTFFDPRESEGFYFGLFGSSMAHSAGRVSLGDTRLATLGWRGGVGLPGLSLDASLSPVIGSRLTGKTLKGQGYVAASASLGLYIPVYGDFDVGLSFEPTLNLLAIGSDASVANKSYCDICLFVCLKKLTLTQSLRWGERPPP
jgi:hypothetical protein